jgi:hypothetical protein
MISKMQSWDGGLGNRGRNREENVKEKEMTIEGKRKGKG